MLIMNFLRTQTESNHHLPQNVGHDGHKNRTNLWSNIQQLRKYHVVSQWTTNQSQEKTQVQRKSRQKNMQSNAQN